MSRLKNFINYFFILTLICFSFFISYKNFVPGTFLLGWDNLPWEFGHDINLARNLSVVWQEYQGLGLLGGMAHVADLPRQIYLLFASIFLPLNFLRYSWAFLMLVIGPLGAYFLAKKLTRGKNMAAFVAGVFYLVNLSTVQTFYTPFESFISFFGFLPWLIYSSVNYLAKPNRGNTMLLFLIHLLGTSAFYVQTLFVVYASIMAVIIAFEFLRKRNFLKILKLGIFILSINAFWLLPVVYFSATNADVTVTAKINEVSTIETRLMNQATGNLSDMSLIKGFWFNYQDFNNGQFDYLMKDWRNYLSPQYFEYIGYGLFALSILGFLTQVKNRSARSTGTVFALSFLMLTAGSGVFSLPFQFFDKIPLFAQAFRSPFTKWSTAFSLFYAIGLALAIASIMKLKLTGKILGILVGLVIIGSSLVITRPVFEGKLISDSMRVEVPSEYFKLFDFMRDKPEEARIARFPVATFWGWDFNEWSASNASHGVAGEGYRGSGFLWYGIRQPILDRAFDVWSDKNETYYNEISTAVYANDEKSFSKVLEKYNVRYALVDESVVTTNGDEEILRYSQIKDLLTEIGARKVFDEGFLSVWELENERNFVFAPQKFVLAETSGGRVREDLVYKYFGNYIGDSTAYFPFSNLTSEKTDNIKVEDMIDVTKISLPILGGFAGSVTIPPFRGGEVVTLATQITLENGHAYAKFRPFATVSGNNIMKISDIDLGEFDEIPLVSINGFIFGPSEETYKQNVDYILGSNLVVNIFDRNNAKTVDLSSDFASQEVTKCWERENSIGEMTTSRNGDSLLITTKNAAGCLSFALPTQTNDSILSVSLPFSSSSGARPHFCVLEGSEQVDCANRDVFYSTSSSLTTKDAKSTAKLAGGSSYYLSVAARPSDKKDETWEITYEAPVVEIFTSTVEFSLDGGPIWRQFQKEEPIQVTSEDNISIFSYPITIPTDNFSIPENCDNLARGGVRSEVRGDFLTLIADHYAANCVWQKIPVSQNRSYLIRFVGENLSGRGMKAYLFNEQTKRTDIEIILPQGKFDQIIPILSWGSDEGYTLVLETRSFSEKAESRIDKVVLYPVNLENIAGTYMGQINQATNDLRLINSRKIGTYRYDVTTRGGGLMVLSQGYNGGWEAYKLPNYSGLNGILPWLFGEKLDHRMVNGWENGWVIGDGEEENKVVILFLPQYLQFFGFLVLFLAFCVAITSRDRH